MRSLSGWRSPLRNPEFTTAAPCFHRKIEMMRNNRLYKYLNTFIAKTVFSQVNSQYKNTEMTFSLGSAYVFKGNSTLEMKRGSSEMRRRLNTDALISSTASFEKRLATSCMILIRNSPHSITCCVECMVCG